ncbi:MAG: hypothetical protein QG608_844 [Actinomycetota bacterium]|nr:hypothetical protein [Actinomycetota bacterium]
MRTVATYAIKGGVGKTTAAVNLAQLAACEGHRTLLWDLDPQGSATFLFRVRPWVKGGAKGLVTGSRPPELSIKGTDVEGLDLLPADFRYRVLDRELDAAGHPRRRLRSLLGSLSQEYDLVILDCPPSVSLTCESVLMSTDLLLVPVVPAPLATRSLDQLLEFLAELGRPQDRSSGPRRPQVMAFLSMVDRRRKIHRDLVESLLREQREITDVVVPACAAVEQMAQKLEPVAQFAPRSTAAVAYRELWDRVRSRIGLSDLSVPPRPSSRRPAGPTGTRRGSGREPTGNGR